MSKVTSDTIKSAYLTLNLKRLQKVSAVFTKQQQPKKSKRSKNVNRKGSRLPEAKIKMPRFLKRNRVDSLKWK